MRKILVFNNLSVDGQFSDAKGGLDWAHRDGKELAEYVQQKRGEVSTFLFGRVTFQMFASFWPTPAGKAASPYFAKVLNEGQKVVFSRTLRRTDWEHTVIQRSASPAALKKFKASAGGDCLVFGSGRLVRALAAQGLVDEYQLVINPVALGKGRPLFAPLAKRLDLGLIEAKAFKNGTVLLRYEPR
ncbi:MAG TPA: dihydrofolate reductase family protein [bacterium]|nr:dihydrofolate reductase family protein [bacterium]